MKYGAYHVWLRVKGLTADEPQGALLTLEGGPGPGMDFAPEQDGSIRIECLLVHAATMGPHVNDE